MVVSLLLVGVASAASGLMAGPADGVYPVELPEDVYVDDSGTSPWVMGIFFLSLAVSEVSLGTLLLYYFGKHRAFDVGIVPLELEEDELERLFEEFMRTP